MSAHEHPATWPRHSCLCVFIELKPHRQECLCHQAMIAMALASEERGQNGAASRFYERA